MPGKLPLDGSASRPYLDKARGSWCQAKWNVGQASAMKTKRKPGTVNRGKRAGSVSGQSADEIGGAGEKRKSRAAPHACVAWAERIQPAGREKGFMV